MNVVKALQLACSNADGVRGRKLELEHIISQHGVDICLLTEIICDRETSFGLQTIFFTEETGPQTEAGQQCWSSGV
jgi:hypothetical protein